MPGPRPAAVALTDAQRHELGGLTRRHSAPQQLVFRARIILAAADGLNNAQIARRLGTTAVTARLWRNRWVGLSGVPAVDLSIEDRLADAPRAGRPARIAPEQVCAIVALACEAPARSGRPITHWSGREIADEIVARGVVARLSPRHAGRLLKTAGPPAAPRAALADPGAR
jgi:transposase